MQTVIWPILTGVALVAFILHAIHLAKPQAGTLEWVHQAARPMRFAFPEQRRFVTGRDIAAMLLITALYAGAAFFYLGDTKAPQTFLKFTPEQPSVTIEFAEPQEISDILYYTGLAHGEYELAFSLDGVNWEIQKAMTQSHGELFRWRHAQLNEPVQTVKYIRVSVGGTGSFTPLELGALALYTPDSASQNFLLKTLPPSYKSDRLDTQALFDEDWAVPNPPEATILNGTHFDEIYHARTAYEHILGYYPYEITHPPLGKLLLGLGIRAFGMTPFGWRFVGTLFGVLMVPVFYLLAKRLFMNTMAAACSTLLFAFDFMHFTQTRIATIDVYGVFFILCMYLFMVIYVSVGLERPFKQTMLPLFLCGLSFGLGISSKWICFYAALGLIVLLFTYLLKRRRYLWEQQRFSEFWPFFWKTVAWCVLCFVVIPGAIYTACYIPYAMARNDGGVTLKQVIQEMWNNQSYMLNYHGSTNEPHVYSSRWYQWVGNIRPILYWMSVENGNLSRVMAFVNPVVCWGGLLSLVFSVWHFVKTKCWQGFVIVVGFLSQLLPWVFITRTTFEYHYFPSVVFLALALGYAFTVCRERKPKSKAPMLVTLFALLLFALFYPALSGFPYSEGYSKFVLRWFATWPI